MSFTAYGDISPSTAAYLSKDFLKRGIPYLVLEKFGQSTTLPERATRIVKFRRYNPLPNTPNQLIEGVTPAGQKLSVTEVTLELQQYGSWVPITDVVLDTHEDPVLQQANMVLSEQAAQMVEKVRYGALKASTNVFYPGGVSALASVAGTLDLTMQRRVTRSIKRMNGRPITKVVRSTPSYQTENVAPAYIAIVHPDLEPAIRSISGFTPAERYGAITPFENEIGKAEDVRYLTSTLLEPTLGAGSATGAGTSWLSVGGAANDVYPILFLASDAYGLVALKGKFAVDILVANPKPVAGTDPMAQQGSVAWKSMQGAVILNDAWLAVAWVCAPF